MGKNMNVVEDDFEIQDDVKTGTAEYYLEKAKYFWELTEALKEKKKISDSDYDNSVSSFRKIMGLYEKYTLADDATKNKCKNDLIWAVAKYSSAVLYLEDDSVNKNLLSW